MVMGNIKNFNFNKLDLKLSNSEYWDFYLATDEGYTYNPTGVTSGDSFVVWYDFNNPNIFISGDTSATTIYSLVTWTGATNTGYTMTTIGLTGIDNGLVIFEKISGDTSNQALMSALTGSTLIIPSGDTRLVMNAVTGTTGNFIYPITYVIDSAPIGNYVNLCGGFYQGYYKLDGNSYEVLPVRMSQAWGAEFWLNPQDGCSGYTGTTSGMTGTTTLNEMYPNNAGFFFYMGTRAENKFWNVWNGADVGCTSACTVPSGCTDILSPWCTVVKENDVTIVGDYGVGIPLDPPQVYYELITNGFLIYGRSYDGSAPLLTGATNTLSITTATTESQLVSTTGGTCEDCGDDFLDDGFVGDFGTCGISTDGLGAQRVGCYDGNGIIVVKTAKVRTDFTNGFLVYGRGSGIVGTGTTSGCTCEACIGPRDGYGSKTVCSYSGYTSPEYTVDYAVDIIDNALGFRVTDNGAIGYRLLTVTATTGNTCITGVTVDRKSVV